MHHTQPHIATRSHKANEWCIDNWDGGAVGANYHKLQIVSWLAQSLHLIIELVHRLTNFLKWVEYGIRNPLTLL